MQTVYYIAIWVGIVVAVIYSLLVFATGKGDAMSGGGGAVRTTFKGKASFDDIMSRWTFFLGVAFMVLMLLIDMLGNHLLKGK